MSVTNRGIQDQNPFALSRCDIKPRRRRQMSWCLDCIMKIIGTIIGHAPSVITQSSWARPSWRSANSKSWQRANSVPLTLTFHEQADGQTFPPLVAIVTESLRLDRLIWWGLENRARSQDYRPFRVYANNRTNPRQAKAGIILFLPWRVHDANHGPWTSLYCRGQIWPGIGSST